MSDYTCLDCLPQNSNAIIRDYKMRKQVLGMILTVLNTVIEALEKFYIQRSYEEFDPHVGETGCQLRACIHVLLSVGREDVEHRLEELANVEKKISCYITKLEASVVHEKNNIATISEYLANLGFLFTLEKTEKFLLESYFLTKFKHTAIDGSSYICHDLIKSALSISTKSSKKLVRYYQISLANFSVNYIFFFSEELQWCERKKHLLKQLEKNDDDDRRVLPCYIYTHILLDYLLFKNRPILVISEVINNNHTYEVPLYFDPCPEKKDYLFKKNPELVNNDRVCFVVRGKALSCHKSFDSYIKQFIRVGLRRIVMANMAAHPQYSGNKLASNNENPYSGLDAEQSQLSKLEQQLFSMRVLAESEGCSQSNKSLFYIEHIYCNSLSKELSSLNMSYNDTIVSPFNNSRRELLLESE